MLNCKKITKDTQDLMFELMRNSVKDKRERYIKLCENKNKDVVSSTPCAGSKCQVSIKKINKLECPTNTDLVGDFHTHPISNSNISDSDILGPATFPSKSFCIGSSPVNTIRCYDVKNKELSKLGDEVQELVQKGKMNDVLNIGAKMRIILSSLGRRSEPYFSASYWKDVLEATCEITRKIE